MLGGRAGKQYILQASLLQGSIWETKILFECMTQPETSKVVERFNGKCKHLSTFEKYSFGQHGFAGI
ncbi:unnamed protein product [Caretta caretta]